MFLRSNTIDLLYGRRVDYGEFNFDHLSAPDLYQLLSTGDIQSLHNIVTSMRMSGNTPKKKKAIDEIMKNRGFKRLSLGTNRLVYKFLEDQSIVVKVPIHHLALTDNIREFKNQYTLKPFCSKCFQTDQSGVVGLFERVNPITTKMEYKSVADDVFDLIVNKVLGKVVMEDIGTEYFMNIGVRTGFGVVLIDYPEMFILDGNKLYCNEQSITGLPCGGSIDYDEGFNKLICKRCGKLYKARDIEKNIEDNIVIIRGGSDMAQNRIRLIKNGVVLVDTGKMDIGVDVIPEPPKPVVETKKRPKDNVVKIIRPKSEVIKETDKEETTTKEEKKESTITLATVIKAEDDLLKKEIPDAEVRAMVVSALDHFKLRGSWARLTEAQRSVIIENSSFVKAPNVLNVKAPSSDDITFKITDDEPIARHRKVSRIPESINNIKADEQLINTKEASKLISKGNDVSK